MKKLIFLILVSASFISGCSDPVSEPSKTYSADAAVYQAVLKEGIATAGYQIVLNDSTKSEQYIYRVPAEVRAESLADYFDKNEKPVHMTEIPGINSVFESQFRGPNTNAIHISFSKAGYSQDRMQAIVTTSVWYKGWDGYGTLYVLEYTTGSGWKVKASIGTWMS